MHIRSCIKAPLIWEEPDWHPLTEKVDDKDKNGNSGCRAVDELVEDHVDFLDMPLKKRMLMYPQLLKVSQVYSLRTPLMFSSQLIYLFACGSYVQSTRILPAAKKPRSI